MRRTPIAIKRKVIVKRLPVQLSEVIYVATDNKSMTGKIISLGSEADTDLKVGETVMFSKFAGQEVIVSECSYLVLDVREIYGVLK